MKPTSIANAKKFERWADRFVLPSLLLWAVCSIWQDNNVGSLVWWLWEVGILVGVCASLVSAGTSFAWRGYAVGKAHGHTEALDEVWNRLQDRAVLRRPDLQQSLGEMRDRQGRTLPPKE